MTTIPMPPAPEPDPDHPLLAAAIAALRGLPLDALADYVLFQSDFARWPARRRACFILAANPSFSNARIAALVGVHRSTLYAWPEYLRLRRMLQQGRTPPRGRADGDGQIEAWAG